MQFDRALLQLRPSSPHTRVLRPQGVFLTQVKARLYTLPKIDVQLSGTYQDLPGVPVTAPGFFPNEAAAAMGRPLAGLNSIFPYLNVVRPGSTYGERLNQLDLRFAKIYQVGLGPSLAERRHLQRDQQRHDHQHYQYLHARHRWVTERLAGAAAGPRGALPQDRRAIRFLAHRTVRGLEAGTWGWIRSQRPQQFGATKNTKKSCLCGFVSWWFDTDRPPRHSQFTIHNS